MHIRPYLDQDWPRVCAIHDAARQDELAAADLSAAFLTLEETAENEGFHDYQLRVLEREGQLLAFVAFSADELAWLYVDPACYGQGLGSALVQAALRETGAPMSAEVLQGNQAALSLYLKAGFVVQGLAHGRMPGNERFAVTVQQLQHPGLGPAEARPRRQMRSEPRASQGALNEAGPRA